MDEGINDFHFYSMNRSDLVYAICHLLGLRAQTPRIPAEKIAAAPVQPAKIDEAKAA